LNQGEGINVIDFINENIGWIAGNRSMFKTEDGASKTVLIRWGGIPLRLHAVFNTKGLKQVKL
jgi:hypothetical protein